MKFLELLFNKPRVFALMLIFIILSGIFSFGSVARQENPELAMRWSTVQVVYPGASPTRLETQVIEPVEATLREIYELGEIISFIQDGFGTIVLEIKDEVPPALIEQVWSEVQDKLDQSTFFLPADVKPKLIRSSGPPSTLLYAVTWKGAGESPFILLSRVAEDFKQTLAYTTGTDKANIYGASAEEVLVEISNAKLSALGLTFQDVTQALAGLDNKKPVGTISSNGQEITIKSKDNLISLAEVAALSVKVLNDVEIISLGDIALITKAPLNPPEELSIYNGERAILVEVRGAFNQRVDFYVDSVRGVAEQFIAELPSEISIEEVYDESLYFKQKFENLYGSILFATFIVIGISYFLLGFRSAMIVGSIIPLTIFLVLLGCNMLGVPLHQTSMTGIIIALGLLIDNGIIVVEDYRYRRKLGLGSRESSFASVQHLWIPLTAATVTTALAFFPLVAGNGPSVEFVGDMAVTVILSVTSSLFLALFVVPIFLNFMEKSPYLQGDFFSGTGYSNQKLLLWFRETLTWSYAKPRRAIMIALSLPLIGFLMFPFLKQDFFPELDRNMFQVLIELPQNSSTLKSQEAALEIRESVLATGIVKDDMWFIGRRLPRILYNVIGGDSGLGSNNLAQGVFIATSYKEMMRVLPDLAKEMTSQYPELKIVIDKFNSGPPVSSAVEFRIKGPDLQILKVLGERLEVVLKQAPDIFLTESELSRAATNLQFQFNGSNLALSNLSGNFLINELAIASQGAVIGTMLDGNKELPIRLRASIPNGLVDSTKFLSFPSQDGIDYASSFGEFQINSQVNFISRDAGKRQNTVKAWIWPGLLPSESEIFLKDKVSTFADALPPGYTLSVGGQADARGQSQSNIFSSAFLFLVLIMIALVAALNSFRQATLILSVAGLCTGLAFVGMTLGQANFGFIGLVGAIGLCGLSINDSIVVLSHIKEANAQEPLTKKTLVEVVIRSTRHVITTSATTVGGFLPLLLTSIFFQPLAWAMAGGVIGSAIIALFYIPACYAISKKL